MKERQVQNGKALAVLWKKKNKKKKKKKKNSIDTAEEK